MGSVSGVDGDEGVGASLEGGREVPVGGCSALEGLGGEARAAVEDRDRAGGRTGLGALSGDGDGEVDGSRVGDGG